MEVRPEPRGRAAFPGRIVRQDIPASPAIRSVRFHVEAVPAPAVCALHEPERVTEGSRERHEVPRTVTRARPERILQRSCEPDCTVLLLVFDDDRTGSELEDREVQVPI